MKRRILLLFLILILCISLSNAIKTITVDETELISLKLDAVDEDGDELSYTFASPLDDNGEWQTAYGDEGEYEAMVTVSDGESAVSENVILVVRKRNVGPSIDSYFPEESEVTIREGEEIEFNVVASDLNGDSLTYLWRIDEGVVFDEGSFNYKTGYEDEGVYKVGVVVSDGEAEVEKEWRLNVEDFDRSKLLDSIGGLTVNEGDIVELELPNFEEYGLSHVISEPIGEDNHWETNYWDNGLYEVNITITDGEFIAFKVVDVVVEDKDREPIFKPIANAYMEEGQKVAIEFEVSDPDNDVVEFSAESLPAGASIEGNRFEWVTNYDTVKKGSSLDIVLDKFHVLYKPFKIVFIGKSKEFEVRQAVLVIVKDVNRAPILSDLSDIIVNEGEEVIIEPSASDPDGDNIKYSYSGWIDTDRYMTNYEDAGTYKVKVIASDDFSKDEKYVNVIVNDVNRAPVFGEIGKIEINENEKLEFELSASDPDGDSVNITSEVLPRNATIGDNVFVWTPDYDTLGEDFGVFGIDFKASDGEDETVKSVNITVYDVNRAPRITAVKQEKPVYAGKKSRFEVVAEDDDGDELTYRWEFGLLEKYEGEAVMVRTFTSAGEKKVKVVVSDGEDESEYVFNVKVIGTVVKKVVEKKKEVKKPVKKVVEKKVVQPTVEEIKKGYLYDQYVITTVDERVVDEDKESFVVYD